MGKKNKRIEAGTLEVQHFLRSYGLEKNEALDQLMKKFSIKHRVHHEYANLINFKYNSIESPMDKKIVQECRGLVLDKQDSWRVVARGYDKFFNAGEHHAAQIDWGTAKVFEKLDGTLIIMYWYEDHWEVGTTGTPDADIMFGAMGGTFRDLFWKSFKALGYLEPDEKQYCYLFELMTPENTIVVQHQKPRLVLHGVRNPSNGDQHYPMMWADKYKWECAKLYPLHSVRECQEAADTLNPLENEGYVVTDLYFNRIKIKSPKYVAMHYTATVMSPRKMLDTIIRMGEGPEFLTYFPQHKPVYEQLKTGYDKLLTECEAEYVKYQGIKGQWPFVQATMKHPLRGALLARHAGKSFKDFWAKCPLKSLQVAMGLRDPKRKGDQDE